MNMPNIILQIINLSRKYNLFTDSKTSEKVAKRFEKNIENESLKVVLTSGYPASKMQCSRCKKYLDAGKFSFYQSRVNSSGYLMRTNAICKSCTKRISEDRKKALRGTENIPKPRSGSRCPKCKRKWTGLWHKHHDPTTKQFVAYWCGNCNMAWQDQRNPHLYKGGSGNADK